MLKKIKTKDNEKKLQIVSEHVTVSMFSNVPEYDNKPIFICDSEPKKLIKNFVKTILKISLKAKSINENKYSHIIKFLDAHVNNNQEINGPSNIYDDKQLKLLSNYENNVKNATS
jgi:hypothetical protein